MYSSHQPWRKIPNQSYVFLDISIINPWQSHKKGCWAAASFQDGLKEKRRLCYSRNMVDLLKLVIQTTPGAAQPLGKVMWVCFSGRLRGWGGAGLACSLLLVCYCYCIHHRPHIYHRRKWHWSTLSHVKESRQVGCLSPCLTPGMVLFKPWQCKISSLISRDCSFSKSLKIKPEVAEPALQQLKKLQGAQKVIVCLCKGGDPKGVQGSPLWIHGPWV